VTFYTFMVIDAAAHHQSVGLRGSSVLLIVAIAAVAAYGFTRLAAMSRCSAPFSTHPLARSAWLALSAKGHES
jgi:hypothetical protein